MKLPWPFGKHPVEHLISCARRDDALAIARAAKADGFVVSMDRLPRRWVITLRHDARPGPRWERQMAQRMQALASIAPDGHYDGLGHYDPILSGVVPPQDGPTWG